MVVSRKRKDARVPKKNHNNTFSILTHAYPHVSPKEPLGSNTSEKDSCGLSITKVSEGKRKAHAKLNSSPSTEAKELIISSNGPAHTSLGQARLEAVGHFSKGLSKTKPNSNSVKGKKDFARTRASYSSPSSTVIPKERHSTKSKWSFSISKIHYGPNGDFKFDSKPGNKMGDQCGRLDYGDPTSDYRRDHSTPYPHHGMVQPQTLKGMEITVPSNSNECSVGLPLSDRPSMAKGDRPLVEVPLKHLGPGRSEKIGLGHHSSSINDFGTVRSDIRGEPVHKENVGKPSHCNNIHRQLTCNKAYASFPTHHGV